MTLPNPRDSELWFSLLLWHWHSILAKPVWLCCAVALTFNMSTTHQSTNPHLFHSFYNAALSTYNARWWCRGSDTDFQKVWSLSVSLANMSSINTNKWTRCGTNFTAAKRYNLWPGTWCSSYVPVAYLRIPDVAVIWKGTCCFSVQYRTGACNKPFVLTENIMDIFRFFKNQAQHTITWYVYKFWVCSEMFRICRNFFDAGRTAFWGNSTFLRCSRPCNRHYTVKMLFTYKSMLKFINCPLLLQGNWCRNGGGRKGWISCRNTAQPKQAIGSNTWHCADLHRIQAWICIYFGQISSQHVSVTFHTNFETCSLNAKRWIELFIARSGKRLF